MSSYSQDDKELRDQLRQLKSVIGNRTVGNSQSLGNGGSTLRNLFHRRAKQSNANVPVYEQIKKNKESHQSVNNWNENESPTEKTVTESRQETETIPKDTKGQEEVQNTSQDEPKDFIEPSNGRELPQENNSKRFLVFEEIADERSKSFLCGFSEAWCLRKNEGVLSEEDENSLHNPDVSAPVFQVENDKDGMLSFEREREEERTLKAMSVETFCDIEAKQSGMKDDDYNTKTSTSLADSDEIQTPALSCNVFGCFRSSTDENESEEHEHGGTRLENETSTDKRIDVEEDATPNGQTKNLIVEIPKEDLMIQVPLSPTITTMDFIPRFEVVGMKSPKVGQKEKTLPKKQKQGKKKKVERENGLKKRRPIKGKEDHNKAASPREIKTVSTMDFIPHFEVIGYKKPNDVNPPVDPTKEAVEQTKELERNKKKSEGRRHIFIFGRRRKQSSPGEPSLTRKEKSTIHANPSVSKQMVVAALKQAESSPSISANNEMICCIAPFDHSGIQFLGERPEIVGTNSTSCSSWSAGASVNNGETRDTIKETNMALVNDKDVKEVYKGFKKIQKKMERNDVFANILTAMKLKQANLDDDIVECLSPVLSIPMALSYETKNEHGEFDHDYVNHYYDFREGQYRYDEYEYSVGEDPFDPYYDDDDDDDSFIVSVFEEERDETELLDGTIDPAASEVNCSSEDVEDDGYRQSEKDSLVESENFFRRRKSKTNGRFPKTKKGPASLRKMENNGRKQHDVLPSRVAVE